MNAVFTITDDFDDLVQPVVVIYFLRTPGTKAQDCNGKNYRKEQGIVLLVKRTINKNVDIKIIWGVFLFHLRVRNARKNKPP